MIDQFDWNDKRNHHRNIYCTSDKLTRCVISRLFFCSNSKTKKLLIAKSSLECSKQTNKIKGNNMISRRNFLVVCDWVADRLKMYLSCSIQLRKKIIDEITIECGRYTCMWIRHDVRWTVPQSSGHNIWFRWHVALMRIISVCVHNRFDAVHIHFYFSEERNFNDRISEYIHRNQVKWSRRQRCRNRLPFTALIND